MLDSLLAASVGGSDGDLAAVEMPGDDWLRKVLHGRRSGQRVKHAADKVCNYRIMPAIILIVVQRWLRRGRNYGLRQDVFHGQNGG